MDYEHETVRPDIASVDRILKALSLALHDSVLPEVTTQADVLSAAFTFLFYVLKSARDTEGEEFRTQNATEIGRVLGELLLEFGYSGTPN